MVEFRRLYLPSVEVEDNQGQFIIAEFSNAAAVLMGLPEATKMRHQMSKVVKIRGIVSSHE